MDWGLLMSHREPWHRRPTFPRAVIPFRCGLGSPGASVTLPHPFCLRPALVSSVIHAQPHRTVGFATLSLVDFVTVKHRMPAWVFRRVLSSCPHSSVSWSEPSPRHPLCLCPGGAGDSGSWGWHRVPSGGGGESLVHVMHLLGLGTNRGHPRSSPKLSCCFLSEHSRGHLGSAPVRRGPSLQTD